MPKNTFLEICKRDYCLSTRTPTFYVKNIVKIAPISPSFLFRTTYAMILELYSRDFNRSPVYFTELANLTIFFVLVKSRFLFNDNNNKRVKNYPPPYLLIFVAIITSTFPKHNYYVSNDTGVFYVTHVIVNFKYLGAKLTRRVFYKSSNSIKRDQFRIFLRPAKA